MNGYQQHPYPSQQPPMRFPGKPQQQGPGSGQYPPQSGQAQQRGGYPPPPSNQQPGISGQTISQAGGPTPTLNQLLQSSGGGGAGGAQPMPPGQHMYPPTGGYDHGYAPHSKGDYGGHWTPGPPPPSNGPPVNSYGHPPSSQHMLSQQQQSMYRQGAPPGPGRGPPGPPPPSGPGQYYSPHHAGGGPPPPQPHQQFPPPSPQSPHYPPPPPQPPHAQQQQQQQRPYPPNLPPPRPGENQAHYPPGPPPPSNQQPPSHYPPGGVGSESPGLPPPSNSSSSGEGQPPKSTPPPPPSPSLVQQHHHQQMNHQGGGPNPPSPSASRSSAQPQLPPPQGTNNSSSPSHRPQGSSPSNSNSNSNAYPESGECNSNDSGGAQGARPSPSPTPRSMSPAVGGYPGQSMAPPQHHAMYPGGKLSHLPQMQQHYQQGPQQQHWQQQQQQQQQGYPATGAARHHGGYPPPPPGQQPGPNNYPHPLPPQTRPSLPNHVAGTPPPPQSPYPYGPPPPGYGPGGPPPQQGQTWPPPQAQPQNQSQNPQQRSHSSPHPHYLKHHLQQKMGYGSPPQGGGYGGQMGPPSGSGLPSSSPTPPLGSSGPHHLPPPPHEAENAELSNANPPNIVSVGPDGAPVDEASQQSTLSNASGTSGGDEGPQMPKLRKEGPVSHTYQSHPPTPQGNAVHSPGAVSMGSIHEDYGEMSSPGWPKTPASPVLNSHPQPPPPSDHYRSKVKKPDSMNKLYDMDDNPERRMFLDKLLHYMEEHGTPITACPTISKNPLDLFRLYFLVKERGGFLEVTKNKTWKDIAGSLGIGASSSAAYTLRKHYTKHLLPFECKFDRGGCDPQPLINQVEASSKKKGSKAAPVPSPGSSNSQDSFPGPAATNNSSMDGFGGPSYPPYPPGGPGDYGQTAPPGGPPPSVPPGSQRGAPPPGQSPQNQSTHPGDKNISVSNPFDDMHPSNQYLHQFHPSHNQQQQGGRANYYPPYSTPPPTGYQGPPGSYPQYPPPPGQEYSRGPGGAPPAGHEPYAAGQPYPQSNQGPYPPGPRPMYGGYPGETPPPGGPPAAPSAYPPAHPPPPQGAAAAPAPAVPPPPPSEDGRYNAMGPPSATTGGGPPPPGQSPYPPQGRPPFPPQAPNGYPNQDYYHSQPPPPTDQGYPSGSGPSPGSHGGGKHMPPPHPSQGRRVDYPPTKEGQAAGQPPTGAPYSGFLPPAGKEPAGPAGATTFPGYPPQGQGPPQQQRMPPYGWQNSSGQYPPSGPPQPSAVPPTSQPGRGGAYPGPSPTPGGAVAPSPGPPHPHPQAATSSAPPSHSPGAPASSSPSQAPPQPWAQMAPSSRGPPLGQPAPPSGPGAWAAPDGRYGPGSPVPSVPPVPQVSPAGSSWAQPRPPRPGFPPPPGKGTDMYKNFSSVGGMIPPSPPVSVGGSPGKPMMSGPLAHMNELSTMRMGPPPHPLPPMSPQPQAAQFSSSSGSAKKEVAFPHDSIEAVTPLLTRRHKLHKNNVAPVEAWRIMMCLKSGLLAETTWALDVLNVLLYDDQSVSYFSLTYLPGLMEILLEHLRRSLILIFGQAVGIDQGDLKTEDGLKSKDRKWFETTIESVEEGVDLGVPNGVELKEGNRTLVLSGTNYTFVSRISGDKVGILNREEEPFIVSGPRVWDSDEKARNDPDFVGHPTATMDLTRHVITSFASDLNIVPTIRILKDEKKENEKEPELVVVKEEPVDIEEEKEVPLPVPSHRFPLRRNSQVLNLPTTRSRRTRSVTDNNNEDETKKQKKKEELTCNGQSDDAMSLTGENSNSSHEFPEKKPGETLLVEGGVRVKDPGCSLKRRKMEEFEDECYTRDEPSLYHVTESQDSLARRCLSICNILRNLTFVPGNDVEFGKNMNFLSLMGKLLLLHHEHPLKGKPTSKRMKMMEEDSSALNGAEDEDGLIAVAAAAAAAAEIDSESCTSLCGADEEWWWEYMHHIREHVLVMISNISGQMDLSSFSEEVSRPVLDGLLHWAVCPAAYGQDPFPTLGPSSGSNLSPQRLAIESLCKLSVTQGNVDLLLATPPYSRIERLCQLLCRCLCRTEDQVIREFSVNLISYLSAADSGVARTIALQNPCISLLISFIEQAESNAMNIANNHGFSVLRDNPEAMGTSLDMLRRAAGSLLNLSKHPDNRGLFVQHEPRLLQLVMSQILEQKVAALVSQVLYQCSTPEGLLSNKSNYNNNDIFYTPALSRSRNPAPHPHSAPHSTPHHGSHGHPSGHPGGPNGQNNVSINVSSRLSSGKEPAPNFPFFNNQVVGNKHSSVSTFIPSS